jgi:DNA-binding NarL/FixJ family response regulator
MRLSEREQAILRQLACGRTDNEIARDLGLAEAILKRHLIRLFKKLGVDNRARAVDWARQQGF